MKKAIGTILIICFVMMSYTCNAKAANELTYKSTASLSAAAIDGETGRVLFEKEGKAIRPMASTTKIMTLILALEYGHPDSYVTVSSYAAKMPQVKMGIKEGEQYRLSDLLYAMMLESYNDCAVAIAEHISGSVQQFAKLMNDKAKEIGLNHTYFITANGLDAKEGDRVHSTSAIELALLMRYCIGTSEMKDTFVAVCQTKSHSFQEYGNKRSFTVENKNRLLFEMEDLIAGKTGFTADAGYCYVCAIKKESSFVVIALLGSGWPPNKNYKWRDVRTIWSVIEAGYTRRQILSCSEYEENITVYNGFRNVILPVCVTFDVDLLLCDADQVEYILHFDPLEAPIKRGEQIGTLEIKVNDETTKSVSCHAKMNIPKVTIHTFIYSALKRYFFQ